MFAHFCWFSQYCASFKQYWACTSNIERFCVRLLSRFYVIPFFIPATTANDLRLRRIFYPRFYPLHFFPYLNSSERASIFSLECSVPNKWITGTIFITSLVWSRPCRGIEPGPTALEASPIPLGYRGGGVLFIEKCKFLSPQ